MGLRDQLRRMRSALGAHLQAVTPVDVVIEYEADPDADDLFAECGQCGAGLITCVCPRLPRDGRPSVRLVWEPTRTPAIRRASGPPDGAMDPARHPGGPPRSPFVPPAGAAGVLVARCEHAPECSGRCVDARG